MNTKIKKQTARLLNANKLKQSITMLLLVMLIVTLPSCDGDEPGGGNSSDINGDYGTPLKISSITISGTNRYPSHYIFEYDTKDRIVKYEQKSDISNLSKTYYYVNDRIQVSNDDSEGMYILNDKGQIKSYESIQFTQLPVSGGRLYFDRKISTIYKYNEEGQLIQTYTPDDILFDAHYSSGSFSATSYDRTDDYIWNNGNIVEMRSSYIQKYAFFEETDNEDSMHNYFELKSSTPTGTRYNATTTFNYTDIPSSKGAMVLNLGVGIKNSSEFLAYMGYFGSLPKNMIESGKFVSDENPLSLVTLHDYEFNYEFDDNGNISVCTKADTYPDSEKSYMTRYFFEYSENK